LLDLFIVIRQETWCSLHKVYVNLCPK